MCLLSLVPLVAVPSRGNLQLYCQFHIWPRKATWDLVRYLYPYACNSIGGTLPNSFGTGQPQDRGNYTQALLYLTNQAKSASLSNIHYSTIFL